MSNILNQEDKEFLTQLGINPDSFNLKEEIQYFLNQKQKDKLSNIQIQKAEEKDAKEIVEVTYKAWLKAYPNKDYGVTEEIIKNRFLNKETRIQKWQESISKNTGNIFVAKIKDKVVGHANFEELEEFNQLKVIYVDPEYQGLGVGTKLVTKILESVNPNKNLIVEYTSYNTKAENFYKKMGFENPIEIESFKVVENVFMPQKRMTLSSLKFSYLINEKYLGKSGITDQQKIPLLRGGKNEVFDGVDILPEWKKRSLFPFWNLPKNKDLEAKAKELRQAGVLAETLFWQAFNKKEILGYDIDRQYIIGNYIVDFFIAELGLVFEIDGESHDFEGEKDLQRENYLVSLGLELVHFEDLAIKKNIDQIGEMVQSAIKKRESDLQNRKSTPSDPRSATPQKGNIKSQASLKNSQEGNIKDTSSLEDFQNVNTKFVTSVANLGEGSATGAFSKQISIKDENIPKKESEIGFSLDKFSASYWRGDQKRDIRMQRIYALVFDTVEELKEFQHQREEVKKRDHRVLNETQKYYTISELVGAGLPLLQPKLATVRKLLEDYLWQINKKRGSVRVITPHIAKKELYQTSGHWDKFGDELLKVKGKYDDFCMKPMNCPHHMQIFADQQWSYRDLPVRYFEAATVYRDEKPGQLSGLTRVRSITQDDGHLFCRLDQISDEACLVSDIIDEFYEVFSLKEGYWVSLSVRDPQTPEKYLGTDENWKLAEEALEKAAIKKKLNYKRIEGEAAFYGPKLDFMFKDSLGREWQLATIQCDFNLPQRFNLEYVAQDGSKQKPVVIHRAISGALERFLGVYIDHTAGRFPFWLAPTQIKILTINDQVLDYVEKVKTILNDTVLMKPLKYNEIRFEVDDRNESLGKKIRENEMQKIPVIMIVGPKDVAANTVSLRTQDGENKVNLDALQEFLKNL